MIRLRRLAREVFATDEAMAQWLSTADPALGGRTLLEILATDVGTAKAVHRVLAMFHGVPM